MNDKDAGVEMEVAIYLASKTRWACLRKVVCFPAVPAVGTWLKFDNPVLGDDFGYRVGEVEFRESRGIFVMTELLDDVDGRGYSFEDEGEFDEAFDSYVGVGWKCEHGVRPNRRVLNKRAP